MSGIRNTSAAGCVGRISKFNVVVTSGKQNSCNCKLTMVLLPIIIYKEVL